MKKSSLKWLTGLSVVILLVILFFGLRPKGFNFANNVGWTHDQSGISFSKYSLAYTDPISEFSKEDGLGANGFSVEIALKPSSAEEGFNLILTLHNGDDEDQFLVGQWRSWIITMNGDDYDHKRRIKRISVNNASRPPAVQFLTITTGKEGTKVYIGGILIRTEKDLTLSIPYGDKSRLTIGNSVYGKHSWHGEIYGLAFYGYALADNEVSGHFRRWSNSRNFNFAGEGKPYILYLFDEKGGNTALDHSGNNHPLKIPSKMPVLEKEILATKWGRLEINSRSLQDMVVNLVGFIPLGFILQATFYQAGSYPKKYGFLITIAMCFTVSFAIEIVQAWMPSRSSSQMDLICNTAGSVIGIFMAHWALKKEWIRFYKN